VRVLKAMCQGCDVFRCYVTFEAKDLADGGQTKIYQAVVRCQIPIDVNISTLSFRECVQLVRGNGLICLILHNFVCLCCVNRFAVAYLKNILSPSLVLNHKNRLL
jgi:hypothetical protein